MTNEELKYFRSHLDRLCDDYEIKNRASARLPLPVREIDMILDHIDAQDAEIARLRGLLDDALLATQGWIMVESEDPLTRLARVAAIAKKAREGNHAPKMD